MAENLNVGQRIDSGVQATDNQATEKYCFNNNEAECTTRGGLYSWDEMMDYSTSPGAKGICPSGWHVPTREEWWDLEITLGLDSNQVNTGSEYDFRGTHGSDLMEGGSSGFEWLMGTGYSYGVNGTSFNGDGSHSLLYTSTQSGSSAYYSFLYTGNLPGVRANATVAKYYSFSVRCVKD